MNPKLTLALALAGAACATQASAQITFYEHDDFQGRSFTTQRPIGNFERFGFNDRSSSVLVQHGRWEVCVDARFQGRCMILRPGRYASLANMGLDDRISSARRVGNNAKVGDGRYAPAPVMMYDAHRRDRERLFQADVTSVHAVVGRPEQRCWVEHDNTPPERGSANVPGAIVGGLIGGILGHQVGNGRGQDAATVVGAVGGAAVGANVGRDGDRGYGRDVQRCDTVSGEARPAYWDVTYDFRGQQHRMQVSAPPGRTVTVNEQGEPRG